MPMIDPSSVWTGIAESIKDTPLLGDRYRPIRFVSQGATGYLVQLEELTLKAPRAMKILKPGLPDMVSPDGKVKRSLASYFSQEVDRLQDVSHENVVKVYEKGSLELGLEKSGTGTSDAKQSSPYYIMDFVNGSPIAKWVEERRVQITRAELIRIIEQVFSGLSAVHRRQVLHGDVKPDNILVDGDGTVKLTDFGFAKSLVREDTGDTFWCQDKRYLHPELNDRLARSLIDQPSDTGRSIIPTTAAEIQAKGVLWELHALAGCGKIFGL